MVPDRWKHVEALYHAVLEQYPGGSVLRLEKALVRERLVQRCLMHAEDMKTIME